MRFTKSLVLPALTALSLVTPFAALAAPKATELAEALPNLQVDKTNVASQTTVYIRNVGASASAPSHVRIQLESGAIFHFAIWGLQAGEELGLQLPAAQDGKPYSFTVEVDCDQEVAEGDETDNVESLRFIS
jgi:CARDB